MTENDTPGEQIRNLLIFLTEHRLLDGDKLRIPVADVDIPGIATETKEKLFAELFEVKVNMIDNGHASDYFIIHE